jgi:cysteine desulfurase
MTRIYLDHNATTRPDPRVLLAMRPHLEDAFGNPSSLHEEGRRARDAVERARSHVAALLCGATTGIVFTSGGTESDWLGIVGGARAARKAGKPPRVVTSPLEHPCVRGATEALAQEGFEVVAVPVDSLGRIDPAEVQKAAREGAALLSFALANHELGNLYDLATIADIAHRAGALVHCDAVQAVGKCAVDVGSLGVDLLSLSAHKIHGPKGVGALWIRRGIELNPVVRGGHQERGLRPGTENVAGVVGLGEAARLAREGGLQGAGRIAALRDRLERGALAIAGARRAGDPEHRVGNTTNLAFAGAPGELVVMSLDLEGVAVSTGAACTSGSLEPSPVILALGQRREQAAEAVRFSLGSQNTDDDVDRVLALLPHLVARVRAHAPPSMG